MKKYKKYKFLKLRISFYKNHRTNVKTTHIQRWMSCKVKKSNQKTKSKNLNLIKLNNKPCKTKLKNSLITQLKT